MVYHYYDQEKMTPRVKGATSYESMSEKVMVEKS